MDSQSAIITQITWTDGDGGAGQIFTLCTRFLVCVFPAYKESFSSLLWDVRKVAISCWVLCELEEQCFFPFFLFFRSLAVGWGGTWRTSEENGFGAIV